MSKRHFGLEQHRYLPSVTPTGGRNAIVRDVLAARWNVKNHHIYLGVDPDTVMGRVLQATVRPGDRCAIALPSAAEFVRQCLAVGAAYVDFGSDFRFTPRQDRLDRLLSDGAVSAILNATPNPVTGVQWQPQRSNDTLVIEDRRASQTYETVAVAPRHVTIGQVGEVIFVVAELDVTDRLHRLAPEPRLSERQHATALQAPTDSTDAACAWDVAAEFGFVAARSDQRWALLRHPAFTASELAEGCDNATVTRSPDPGTQVTWRESVRVLWPGREGLTRLATILGLLSILWGACGPPAPKSAEASSPTMAPSTTRPAPPASTAPRKIQAGRSTSRIKPKANLNRVPVVGGCGALCSDARAALSGFAAALKAPDRQSRLPQYIDSSRLVLDQEPVGDRLSAMWLRGEISPRLQKLSELVNELSGAVKSDDEAALLALAEQAPFSLEQPRKAVASLALPGVPRPWTITLGRRGLEWLVIAISR